MVESVFWDSPACDLVLRDRMQLEDGVVPEDKSSILRLEDLTMSDLDAALKQAADEGASLKNAAIYLVLEERDRRSVDDPSRLTTILEYDTDANLTLEVGVRDPWTAAEPQAENVVSPFLRSNGVALRSTKFDSYSADGDYMAFTLRLPSLWTIRRALSLAKLIGLMIGPEKATPDSAVGAFALLISGRPEGLLGQLESSFLEVKERGYGFQNENQKHEYAMDLAALANSEKGALLVVGLKTVKNNAGQDVIADIRGCTIGSLSVDAYGQIARQRVVPPVEGLELHLIEHLERHILAIMVPAQPNYLKPFLVKGGITLGGRTSGASFTIPTRVGDARWNMSAEAVHSLLVAARAALARGE
ncbi:hypothetical protein AB0J94_31395 [Micromonospora noduli]|uniref:AlbA family DNA-binding domain-containing protein n=1 Tax=Micromonospora noduli TaxID=709876 RepID=UPI00343B40A1